MDKKKVKIRTDYKFIDGLKKLLKRYIYNELGLLEKREIYNKETILIGETAIAYDKEHRLIKEERRVKGQVISLELIEYRDGKKLVDSFNELGEKAYSYIYNLSAEGHFLEANGWSFKSNTPLRTSYVYNEHNLLVKAEHYDDGELTETSCHEYDEHGNITAVKAYDDEGKLYLVCSKIYDRQNLQVSEKRWMQIGEEESTEIVLNEYEYFSS